MEFDWTRSRFDEELLTEKQIEEAFEDPFNLRLLPDDYPEAHYVLLGRSLDLKPVFTIFRTDGRRNRVIFARPMTEDESTFYDRKNAEQLS
ncbi:MAG: BrnT family toxin [Chthoniobacterales bacterium]